MPPRAVLNGPTMSSPQTAKGQVRGMVLSAAIINKELVKRSVTGVFQRCVEPEKGVAILKDIHQGECGHHAASRSLVAKAFRHGFFWPTALEDAKEIVIGVGHRFLCRCSPRADCCSPRAGF